MDNNEEMNIKRPEQIESLKVGIVGNGFVGKALGSAFIDSRVDKMIVDPKFTENTLKDLNDFSPQITFICLPTPSKDDGSIDSSLVEEAVKSLVLGSQSFIVIKSTVTPNVIEALTRLDKRIVYEPEFLTEVNALNDTLHPRIRILGVTDPSALQYLAGVYNNYSMIVGTQHTPMTPVEAAFFKYFTNTFLATKLIFVNEFKKVVDFYGGDWYHISKVLPSDMRIGPTHLMQPGLDNKEGFGGACFPKDMNAWINFCNKLNIEPSLIKHARDANNEIRSQYELSEREEAQNVNYGQTKEKLKNKDNGSSKSE
tara:strand:+ start:1029 stop:1964 length:936 start_codon:yes stop_codon:yes gene_type:complete